jgi:hypothetical protein
VGHHIRRDSFIMMSDTRRSSLSSCYHTHTLLLTSLAIQPLHQKASKAEDAKMSDESELGSPRDDDNITMLIR